MVALLIVISLGLFSPLCCVIHSMLHSILTEPPTVGFFLCGPYQPAVATPVNPDERSDTQTPSDDAPLTPRALYELTPFAGPLLIISLLQITNLAPHPFQRLRPLRSAPPTPPPRLSLG